MLTPIFSLDILPGSVAICQLRSRAAFPKWIHRATEFLNITRTPDELTIICDESIVPSDALAERGYRVLRVKGPLPFDMVGVTAALTSPLATAGVPVIPLATYDTDYLLVHSRHLDHARWALEAVGHSVIQEDSVAKAASF
jgi:Uncharacterized conserved protein